jgi:hypothetical protein
MSLVNCFKGHISQEFMVGTGASVENIDIYASDALPTKAMDGQINTLQNVYSSVSPVFELTGHAVTVLSSSYSAYTGFCDPATSGAKKVMEATAHFWKDLKLVDKIGVLGKFLGGALGILALYTCYKGWEKIFATEQTAKQIDGGLAVVESTGSMAKASVVIGEGLQKATILPSQVLRWTTAISGFGLALSIATSISYAKKSYESYKLTRQITALQEHKESYVETLRGLCELQGIKKNTEMKKADLFQKIENVLSQAVKPLLKEEAAKRIYESLKTRVNSKIKSNALTCLASTVSIIGNAVLLGTPAAPAGFGLLAVSGTISFGEYVYNSHHNNKFEESLKT